MSDYFSYQDDFVDDKAKQSYVSHDPKTLAEARKKKNALRKIAFPEKRDGRREEIFPRRSKSSFIP